MICPHCGKSTSNSEKCVHCSKPTEFVRRTRIRPEKIPHMDELYRGTSLQSTSVVYRKNIILIVSVIITFLAVITSVLYGVRYHQIFSVENDVRSAEKLVVESTQPSEYQAFISLFMNCYDQTENDLLETIMPGDYLPVLQDIENHIFCGWNTDRDGTGMAFRAGDLFMIHISENLSLYAQWETKNSVTTSPQIATQEATEPEITTYDTTDNISEYVVQPTIEEDPTYALEIEAATED